MTAIELLREIINDGFLSESNMQRGRMFMDMEEMNSDLGKNKSFIARVSDLEREVISWRNSFPYLSFDFSSGKFVHTSGNIPDEADVVVAFRSADEIARSQIMTAIEVAVKHSTERAALPRAEVISIESARQPKT